MITVNEISRYLHFADEKDGLEKEKAIDTAILQKLLPKLHGSAKKLKKVLEPMWQLCLKDGVSKEIDAEFNATDFKYPESAEKIKRMYYAVNRQLLDKDSQLWQTLDEMTSMKILSRIEGDSERTERPLEALQTLVKDEIEKHISDPEEGKEKAKSIAAAKIKEMLDKLEKTSYTSYWA